MIQIGATEQGKLSLDLMKLVDTRMLIQANSGGGKSWLLRLIAEQTADKVQTIILDPEGEFATLREKLDMALVGRDGEIQANVRASGLLARKLLELRVSTVIDLYDLKLQERRSFIKQFIESLLSVPKALWHPVIIAIDEAHKYCPERGSGESESTGAIIDLTSQGRKRGFCSILATQRMSKLHKDATAELNNVFIGRCWQDVDRDRAGDTLGMAKSERLALRDLPSGEFYAFGPALNMSGIVKVAVGEVKTTHPKPGERHTLIVPKPSAAIRQIVSQLEDLPKQAEEEIRSLEDAKRKIRELERQARSQTVVPDQQVIERAASLAVVQAEKEWRTRDQQQEQAIKDYRGRLEKIVSIAAKNGHVELPSIPERAPLPLPVQRPVVARQAVAVEPSSEVGTGGLRRILTALAQRPEGLSVRQLGVRAQLSSRSGTFSTYLSKARQQGWIEGSKDRLAITDTGLEALGSYEPLPTGQDLLNYWLRELGDSGESRMLSVLAEAYPSSLSKDELATRAGMAISGTFSTYLSHLRSLELIEGRGELKAADELFQ